jgi:hypothetical protein
MISYGLVSTNTASIGRDAFTPRFASEFKFNPSADLSVKF